MFSQYFCYKVKSCVHDGPKVCGFDEEASFLAIFDDECTLYKVNCKGAGSKYIIEKKKKTMN